ncbi:MAG: cation diffusion facilitator family transporter [Candidatus Magnetoovum sp. WYHC-5]|nr:cation diffusion facilitator family transporter [Candidatus Magnetoovum sp. WYHC-5]
MNRQTEINKVLVITLIFNLLVSSLKIIYGLLIDSVSITSDGYHSLFDGISNIVGIIGIYMSCSPSDEEHPYGHRKHETLFTLFIAVMMFSTCYGIFKSVYVSLKEQEVPVIGIDSFVVMVFTLCVNIFVSRYEKNMGDKLQSEYLIADAKHTKSDIYATIGVIIGLVLVKLGVHEADPIAGTVVGFLVLRAGLGVLKTTTSILVDTKKLDAGLVQHLTEGVQGVIGCHKIRTRGTDGHIFLDLHILVTAGLSIEEGHTISHNVENTIKNNIKDVVDVVIHIEPAYEGRK